MTLIVDCSVAVKWMLDEDGCEDARRLLNRSDLIAPDFLLLESFHAIWKRERRGQALPAQVRTVADFMTKVFRDLHADADLREDASAMSLAHSLAIYDCLYIALAQSQRAPLITADDRQFAAARKAGVEVEML